MAIESDSADDLNNIEKKKLSKYRNMMLLMIQRRFIIVRIKTISILMYARALTLKFCIL